MTRPVLWTPRPEAAQATRMAAYMRWLAQERGLQFADFEGLWTWSTTEVEGFWASIWDFFQVSGRRPETFLVSREMPGARWGAGGRLNFASQILAHADTRPEAPALIVQSETFGRQSLTWRDLKRQTASVAASLAGMGVGPGDRVVAILPNTETALVAFLATASLGAIWSLAAPDMGEVAILDRFRQIDPKVLIAQDGHVHAGRRIDRSEINARIAAGLPSLAHRVTVPALHPLPAGHRGWTDLTRHAAGPAPLEVAFEHPLWIVYSSGTTGNPKPILHSHGGIVLEGAVQSLHQDLGPADRFMWLTSSGWIMWNAQWVGLARGATICAFDGAPGHPDLDVVWRFVAETGVTSFGAGAAFFDTCRKAGITPRALELDALAALGSTGSPMSPEVYDWVYRDVKSDLWLAPISGGTDIAGPFVAGNPMLPVRAGEMQCRTLGHAVHAFDTEGRAVIGEVGELVCTAPLPSMPTGFWGDADGARLRESYFDTYPGIWRHGDWIEITPEGGAVIYGRSDATINRKGLRLGSSEIYRAVEALPEVLDSLVVDLEYLGRDSFMPLFVVLAPGAMLDAALEARIGAAIREAVSARFLPDEIVQIPEVPRTLSGKKLEVPVKKLLLGGDPARVVNRDSMANPAAFDALIRYAGERRDA